MHRKKSWLIITIITALLAGCHQQKVAPETVTAEDTSSAETNWMTDYNAALTKAAAENKYLLIDFAGSDWCHWCIRLDNEVFSQKEFIDYANKNLILVLVDFPRANTQSDEQKAANQALAEKYGIQGFPTVLILNPQGELVKQTGYQQGGTGPYIDMIKSVIAK